MEENYELAYIDYENGMKYKDIAEKYGVTLNTVKSWKTRKWNKDDSEKSVHTKTKGVHTKKNATECINKAVETEESAISENGGLTDKQWLFCVHYVKYWSPTKAYQKAYDCDYISAKANGYKLLRNIAVKTEIDRMKKELEQETFIESRAVIQKYIDIAFADITDFIDFSQVESHAEETVKEFAENGSIKKETTTQIPYTYTKFAMHHSADIDGTLITELSKGKDGMFKVKLADKMQALAFLVKFKDLLNEDERKRLQEEKVKAETMKIRSETKGLDMAQTKNVDLSKLSTEELRALAARNKR